MTEQPYKHPAHWDQALSRALNFPESRARLMTALSWDESTLDTVACGRRGLRLSEIGPVFNECGLLIVPAKLLEAYAELAKIGAACALAKVKGRC